MSFHGRFDSYLNRLNPSQSLQYFVSFCLGENVFVRVFITEADSTAGSATKTRTKA